MLSDRDAKENYKRINAREVLERVAAMPIMTWNYKAQDSSIRHIGPTAQDFMAALGVGEDEKRIATVDADGAALAAIQGLYRMVQEKEARVTADERRITDLTVRLGRLETMLNELTNTKKGGAH